MDDKIIKCPLCEARFDDELDYVRHFNIHPLEESISFVQETMRKLKKRS